MMLLSILRLVVALATFREPLLEPFAANDFAQDPSRKIRPATKEQIDALPEEVYTVEAHGELEGCSICLSDFDEGNRIRRLPCSHNFHAQCIDQWLKRSTRCPLCVQTI